MIQGWRLPEQRRRRSLSCSRRGRRDENGEFADSFYGLVLLDLPPKPKPSAIHFEVRRLLNAVRRQPPQFIQEITGTIRPGKLDSLDRWLEQIGTGVGSAAGRVLRGPPGVSRPDVWPCLTEHIQLQLLDSGVQRIGRIRRDDELLLVKDITRVRGRVHEVEGARKMSPPESPSSACAIPDRKEEKADADST